MKSNVLKKVSALLLAALVCLSLCSCAGSKNAGYVVAPDGEQYAVSRGLYRMVQLTAAAAAASEVDPNAELSAAELMDAEYEGVPVRDWVADRVAQALVRYMLVERLFAEQNGSFTDVEQYYYKSVLDDTWAMYDKLYVMNDVDREGFNAYQYNMLRELQLSMLLSDAGEPLYVSDADVKAFAAEKVARATFIAIGTAKVNGTPLTATETVAAAEFAAKLCEDARSMGMDAAWEKNKLDILKLLDADITTEESPVSTALFTVGAGVFSDKLAADVLAMEAGDVLLLTEEDGSLFIVCREELAADQDVEELRAQYTAVNGYDMLQEYIAAQLNGWQFVADDAAAAKLSPESLRFE